MGQIICPCMACVSVKNSSCQSCSTPPPTGPTPTAPGAPTPPRNPSLAFCPLGPVGRLIWENADENKTTRMVVFMPIFYCWLTSTFNSNAIPKRALDPTGAH